MWEHKIGRVASGRQIGPVGTAVHVVVGLAFLVFGAFGHASATSSGRLIVIDFVQHFGFNVAALAVGLIALPAITVAFQWLRSRRVKARLDETGAGAAMINIVATLGLVIVTVYFVPAISFIGFGAVVFYGASMVLAAFRGYGGCEILAVSNWLLGRDDQIGCLLLSPVDHLEQSRALK